MKLKAVTTTKTDTCLTYAFKRIGFESELNDIEDLEKHFDLIDYFDFSSSIIIGDILVFTHNQENVVIGTHITEEGKILFHNRLIKRHCVVYEGDNLVSDLTRGSLNNSTTPSLRLRNLKEIKVRPTYILRVN